LKRENLCNLVLNNSFQVGIGVSLAVAPRLN
jgi:hypothetical protein